MWMCVLCVEVCVLCVEVCVSSPEGSGSQLFQQLLRP